MHSHPPRRPGERAGRSLEQRPAPGAKGNYYLRAPEFVDARAIFLKDDDRVMLKALTGMPPFWWGWAASGDTDVYA
ncbi:MAG: hypothetical protein Q7R41_05905, partial [Phycisphaerales bacterium]|nr:hypothetical protein [Phycisphaerales bacterium]